MKSREFIRRFVIPNGGVLLRKDGDHHQYVFPSGKKKMSVPVGGGQTEASKFLMRRLRCVLEGKPYR